MKNTSFWHLGEFFCPHTCLSCGKYGGILCDCCKKYNDFCQKTKCLACGDELVNERCPSCELPFDCQFCVGSRKGALGKLIEIYKYHSVRAVAGVLANMLDQRIDGDYQIVPLPTIILDLLQRKRDFRWSECCCAIKIRFRWGRTARSVLGRPKRRIWHKK